MYYIALVKSGTDAIRCENALKKRGIMAQVVSTPMSLAKQGCGYSLKFNAEDIEIVKRAAKENRVEFRSFYRIEKRGRKYFYNLV